MAATSGRDRSPALLVAAVALVLVGFATACTAGPDLSTLVPTQGRPGPALPLREHPGACAAGQHFPSTGTFTVGVAGSHRSALLRLPADYHSDRAYPLLLSLHPFVLDPATWEQYSHLAQQGAQRGYIVATPRGSEPGPRWSVPGGVKTSADDFAFLDALIDQLSDRYCVDPARVFAAGFSAGAAMGTALGCERADRFAAIAASGGSNLTQLCPDNTTTDTLILHGSADPVAPVVGNTIPFTPPVGLSVDSVVARLAVRNGCGAAPTSVRLTPSVLIDRYTNCTHGRLEYWRMQGAGHTWAGSDPLFDLLLGRTDRTINASTAVLDFFDAD